MVMELPQHPTRHDPRRDPPVRWNAPNVLLLLPLLTLLTPFYNRIEPRLLGLPFFYWFLLALLLVTIGFTAMFVALTASGREDGGRSWR